MSRSPLNEPPRRRGGSTAKPPRTPRTPRRACGWSGVVTPRGVATPSQPTSRLRGGCCLAAPQALAAWRLPFSETFGSARWTETASRSTAREPWSALVRQMDRNGVTVDRARTVERFGSARWTETASRSTAREPWSALGPPDGPKRRHGRPRANRGALWVRQMDRNGVTVDRGALWVRQMDRNAVTVDRGALWVRQMDRNAVTVDRARTVERGLPDAQDGPK